MVFRQRFLWKIVVLMLLFVVYSLFNLKKTNENIENIDYDKHVYVLVANKNLYPGYILKQGDTVWRKKLLRDLPKNVIELNSSFAKNIQGMKVRGIVHKGRYVLKNNLKIVPHGSELSASVKAGMVAVNLIVSNDYIASKIRPGDKVNLILTRSFNGGIMVDEILSNVKIIDIKNFSNVRKVGLKNLKNDNKDGSSLKNNRPSRPSNKKNDKISVELILEVPQEMAPVLSEVIHSGFFTVTVSSKRDEDNSYSGSSVQTIIHIKGSNHSMSKSIVIKKGS